MSDTERSSTRWWIWILGAFSLLALCVYAEVRAARHLYVGATWGWLGIAGIGLVLSCMCIYRATR